MGGRAEFVRQLEELGHRVTLVEPNGLKFDYEVPLGRFSGQKVRLGFQVGDDFPLNPPSGPHVSPRILPINTAQVPHPAGGVHENIFFGPDWEYWSRPYPDWNRTDRTVRAYMAHIRRLFETQ
jgi:hypothetical protein